MEARKKETKVRLFEDCVLTRQEKLGDKKFKHSFKFLSMKQDKDTHTSSSNTETSDDSSGEEYRYKYLYKYKTQTKPTMEIANEAEDTVEDSEEEKEDSLYKYKYKYQYKYKQLEVRFGLDWFGIEQRLDFFVSRVLERSGCASQDTQPARASTSHWTQKAKQRRYAASLE